MKNLFILLLLISFLPLANAKFAPDNDMKIYAGDKSANMDKATFDAIIDKMEQIYAPDFKADGRILRIVRKWYDPTVNAYAVPNGIYDEVHMFGGLARHQKMNADGFAMVLCHEIGHHRAGAPKYTDTNGYEQWASAEGQADYFAGSKCMKRYFDWKEEQEQEQQQGQQVAETQCGSIYQGPESAEKCARIAYAGETLGKVLASLGYRTEPSLSTPDDNWVASTITTGYPSVQCRVDTYFRGALCDTDPASPTDDNDPDIGYDCGREGERPACWYNPDVLGPEFSDLIDLIFG